MYNDFLIVVPLYNGEKTIIDVLTNIKQQGFNHIVICDDGSSDKGVEEAIHHFPGIDIILHSKNLGYGANQKSLYNYAIKKNKFKFVIMVHGDGQYMPTLCKTMAEMLRTGIYDIVLASRIITSGAVKNGMPIYKYIANRFLTLFQNIITGSKLSEYHTGYRAYNLNALKKINFHAYSNDFIFDNQLLLSAIKQKISIGEISCPTVYSKHSSSISFRNSLKYGIGVVKETLKYHLKK